MDNVWVATIIQSVVSGIIVVLIRAQVDKKSRDAQLATELEKKMIQKELTDMTVKFVSMEQKHDKAIDAINLLKERVAVLIQKFDDLQTRVFMLADAMDRAKIIPPGHGKVIRKP